MTIYLDLTREFNEGRLRAIICSGQAVVLHRLAIMSKDGDWILREDEETLLHALQVLSRHGAHYRFGAPLELAWLRGGWSSHLEFRADAMRVRTDFFTRPLRITASDLARSWREQEGRDPPFIDARLLAEMKKTNREKDYAVIGELARLMANPRDQLLYSRSALDLIALAKEYPQIAATLSRERPLLARILAGREELETALDAERRASMRANETRLGFYRAAARELQEAWPGIAARIDHVPLLDAHSILVGEARRLLPTHVGHDGTSDG